MPRIYFDIFNWFSGALDHLLTRIQFSRTSSPDLLSGDLRLSWRLKDSPLNENIRRLSLPERLSMNDRLFFCTETTSQHGFSFYRCSGVPIPFGIYATKFSIPPVWCKSTYSLKIFPINPACQTLLSPKRVGRSIRRFAISESSCWVEKAPDLNAANASASNLSAKSDN